MEKVFHFFIFVRDHTTVDDEGEALTLVASGEKIARD